MIGKIVRIKRKTIWALVLLFTIIFTVADILLKLQFLPTIVYVGSEYNYYVFAAIITLSTLCFTILSIIISVSSDKFFGIKLSDIMSFKNVQNNRIQMLFSLLIFDLISVFLLGFQLTMGLTTLLVIVILYSMYSISIILLLLYDEDFIKECIELELNAGTLSNDTKYLDDWMDELKRSIENKNFDEINRYVSYLAILTKEEKLRDIYYSKVNDIFAMSCLKIGVPNSVRYVLKLNNSEADYYYQDDIYSFFDDLKVKDCHYLNDLHIGGLVPSIIECSELATDEKAYCFYKLFSAIYNNTVINEAYKTELIRLIIKLLCNFYDGDYGKCQFDALMGIFRDYVLNSIDKSQTLYEIIITYLEICSTRFNTGYLEKAIAHIIRAIFFYYAYEDSVSEEMKNKLRDIVNSKIMNAEGIDLSIQDLAFKHSKEITKELITDAIYGKMEGDMMEYYSPFALVKTVLWDKKHKLKFSLIFHAVFSENYDEYPYSLIDAEKLDSSCTSPLLNLKNMFITSDENDDDKIDYSEPAINQFEKLQELFDVDGEICNYYNSNVFFAINEIIKNLKERESSSSTSPIIEDILTELKEKLASCDEDLKLSPELKSKNKVIFKIPLLFVYNSENAKNHLVNYLHNHIYNALNITIKDTLDELHFCYDHAGATLLYNKLKGYKTGLCNSPVVKNSRFKATVNDDKLFDKLTNVFNKFSHCRWKGLTYSIVVKKQQIDYDYFMEIQEIKPSDREITDYISTYKVSKNLYCINGIHFNKENAIKYIRENYFVVSGNLTLDVNLGKKDGYIFKNDFFRRQVKIDENKGKKSN